MSEFGDKELLVNILTSVLCQYEVCSMIWSKAVATKGVMSEPPIKMKPLYVLKAMSITINIHTH